MNSKKSNVVNTDNVQNTFRKIASRSKIKFKEYFLRRIGLASHEIRVNILNDLPFSESSPSPSSYFNRSFYHRSIKLCSFQLINSSGTSPSITRVAVLIKIPDGSPLRFQSWTAEASDDGLVAGWEKHFLSAPNYDAENKDPKKLTVPRLDPGSYLSFPDATFQCYVEWPEPIERYELHEEYYEHEVPGETADEMNKYIRELLQHMETWITVELDSSELLPFQWVPTEGVFVPAFKTDGSVVVRS